MLCSRQSGAMANQLPRDHEEHCARLAEHWHDNLRQRLQATVVPLNPRTSSPHTGKLDTSVSFLFPSPLFLLLLFWITLMQTLICMSPQNQVHWTMEVEKCLKSSSPTSYLSVHHQSYVESLASIAAQLKSNTLLLSKRAVISALLTLDLHDRDVIAALVAKNVTSSRDFEWARYAVQ